MRSSTKMCARDRGEHDASFISALICPVAGRCRDFRQLTAAHLSASELVPHVRVLFHPQVDPVVRPGRRQPPHDGVREALDVRRRPEVAADVLDQVLGPARGPPKSCEGLGSVSVLRRPLA